MRGNQTTLSNLDVTIDRSISDPTFELTSGIGSSDTGRITDDGVTNANSLVFNGTCDANDVVSVHMVFNNTDTVIDTFEAGAASWTRPVDHSYITDDGDYSFYITTTDVAGQHQHQPGFGRGRDHRPDHGHARHPRSGQRLGLPLRGRRVHCGHDRHGQHPPTPRP